MVALSSPLLAARSPPGAADAGVRVVLLRDIEFAGPVHTAEAVEASLVQADEAHRNGQRVFRRLFADAEATAFFPVAAFLHAQHLDQAVHLALHNLAGNHQLFAPVGQEGPVHAGRQI